MRPFLGITLALVFNAACVMTAFAQPNAQPDNGQHLKNFSLSGLITCQEIAKLTNKISESGFPMGHRDWLNIADCAFYPDKEKEDELGRLQEIFFSCLQLGMCH